MKKQFWILLFSIIISVFLVLDTSIDSNFYENKVVDINVIYENTSNKNVFKEIRQIQLDNQTNVYFHPTSAHLNSLAKGQSVSISYSPFLKIPLYIEDTLEFECVGVKFSLLNTMYSGWKIWATKTWFGLSCLLLYRLESNT